ncbi:GtrA family protein [Litorihabitans aurantiacus]|uniref:GtrA/DPMS transmembrane domain-containing protein n=1 Tax=Litorihabitans aurantiacus TaxID=1930061 RepID=A0AA37UMC7_9MICO|nr:GtrA family protein [Litorihabitans aurantiacus]GMA30619.1 hypothetical protein GCM10025875_06110 [Litorihabitans aurantiacus]
MTAPRKARGEGIRFLTVGVANTAIDMGLLWVLTMQGVGLIPANLASTTAGLIFSFLVNRRFTFRYQGSKPAWRQITEFLAITLVGLWVIQPPIILLVSGVAEGWGIEGQLALMAGKVAATGVTLVWNFLLYRFVVFRERPAAVVTPSTTPSPTPEGAPPSTGSATEQALDATLAHAPVTAPAETVDPPEPGDGVAPAAGPRAGRWGWLQESSIAIGAGAVFAAVVVLAYRLVNPDYFHTDDALNEFLPNSAETARMLAEGQLPVLTARAISGGNLLVDFGRGPFHPQNLLLNLAWVTDNPHRVGLIWAFVLLLGMFTGSYLLARAGVRLNRRGSLLVAVVVTSSPMFIALFVPAWWNNGLGIIGWVWATAALLWAWHAPRPGRLLLLGATTWALFATGWPPSYLAFALTAVLAAVASWLGASGTFWARARTSVWLAVTVALGALAALPLVSEYFYLGDYLLRADQTHNIDNFLTPSLSQLLGLANPVGGDFMQTFWGYEWLAIPIGFSSLLVVVALLFTRHDATLWRTDRLLQLMAVNAGVLYLMTQLPAQLGPTRWSFRYLPYALVLVAALTVYYLARTERTWSRGRFAVLAVGATVVALWSSWRVEEPELDVLHSFRLPLTFAVGTIVIFWLYANPARRRTLHAALVTFGLVLLWFQIPARGAFFATDDRVPDPAVGAELAAETEGGFLLDAVSALHPNEWAPGYDSSRYLLAGVQVVNGYDPVGQLSFSSFMHQSTHGRLYPDVIDIVGEPAPAPFDESCWLDAYRTTGVLTDADPDGGRHAALEACSFSEVSTRGETTLFTTERDFDDPRSTVSLATPGVEITGDRLVTDRVERVTVDNPTSEAGAVAFARMWWPGYTATLDGERLAVTDVDGVLVQVEVPAGASGEIELSYTPVTWSIAWPTSAVAVLGLLATAWFAHRGRTRATA